MKKNLLTAQSGGPTTAINATLAGILQTAKVSSSISKIYGAKNGIEGVLGENFIDLDGIVHNTRAMELLCQTPAAALGSCRFRLDGPEDNPGIYERIIRIFRKYNIGYFIYIGGNDSMDTVAKLSAYCKGNGLEEFCVMGAPKTIDNDLMGTDHCPGFGSAAKYIATTFSELERDISVYAAPAVTIVEVMGRNAGWLTASSALARLNGETGPSLIYLCEVPFDRERFLRDVQEKLAAHGAITVAVSEGLRDLDGQYLSETTQPGARDDFGHNYIAGAGRVLESLTRERLGCKVRSIELNLMQRSAAHIASEVDLNEARLLGMKSLQSALEGHTGEMASIIRKPSASYEIDFSTVPIEEVANHEKKVPPAFIHSSRNDVTREMIGYLKPLIQGEVNIQYKNGIPKHIVLY